jgi:hypothetical protein
MLRLLYDPVAEIKSFKRESVFRALIYLIASSLMFSAGLLLFSTKLKLIPEEFLIYAIVGSLFGIIGLFLVFAFFFSVAMHVLDGKGGFYEGLATTVLSVSPIATAVMLAGAISFIPYGLFISILVLIYGIVLGSAVFFRAGKELFSLDYFAVFVGVFITKFPILLACCLYFILL